MTFFEFEIDEKDIASAKFIGETRRALVAALLAARRADRKYTQSYISKKTGIDKSTISKVLGGNGNLTLRTIAEIGWALDLEPQLILKSLNSEADRLNHTSHLESKTPSLQRKWDSSSSKQSTVNNKFAQTDWREYEHED